MWLKAALLVVAVASFACGDDSPTNPSPTSTPVSIVNGASTLTSTAYSPNPVNVSVGGTVTWTNNDTTTHTATSTTGAWNSGTIAPGRTFSQRFTSAGSFPYNCTIHPGMVGTVTVQ
jgi:plastocyanin